MGLFGKLFDNKNEKLVLLFSECLSDIKNQIITSPIVSNVEDELVPFLYVMTDVTVFNAYKNRKKYADVLLAYFGDKYNFNQDEDNKFRKRVTFYSKIIGGKREVRGYWMKMLNKDFEEGDFLLLSLVALGDILINSEAGNDYENAPVPQHGIFEIMNFAEIMVLEVAPRIQEYCGEVFLL